MEAKEAHGDGLGGEQQFGDFGLNRSGGSLRADGWMAKHSKTSHFFRTPRIRALSLFKGGLIRQKTRVPNPRRERSGPGGLFVFIRPSPDLFSIDLDRFFGPQGSVIRPD